MAKSKTIDRVCCIALAVMLVITAVIWAGKVSAGPKKTLSLGYEGLFDQSYVHEINIEMPQEDWEKFIRNATMEEYVECSVTIDGEKLSNVAIRAKGNTSLSSVAGLGSQKYSFKIEFDHFVKGRLYHNLDKLSLNNLIYDATLMKDYLAYTLMGKMDVPSPLCSFVQVKVNNEVFGLYLAVEGIEDGFMERNNMASGEMYKPDSLGFGGGRGNGRDFDIEDFRVQEDGEDGEITQTDNGDSAGSGGGQNNGADQNNNERQNNNEGDSNGGSGGDRAESSGRPASEENNEGQEARQQETNDEWAQWNGDAAQGDWGNWNGDAAQGDSWGGQANQDGEGDNWGGSGGGGGGGFNFGMGSSDVKLQYIDDRPSSYSNIFNNAKTDVTEKDQARLIETLKTLNGVDGADPKDAVVEEEVISYFAVHDFLQNGDSYTGMMIHNYYLYEENGRLQIIPWDYNLAFGGMTGTDASSVVNSPIDTPVSDGTGTDRPLIAWILNNEDSLEDYHKVYRKFIETYVASGWLEEEIARVSAMIRPYVESDPNTFYAVEDFDTAIDALQQYCRLRGQSVLGQLNNEIPSTSAAQRANSSTLVQTGSLNLRVLGSMNGGGGFGGNRDSEDGGSGGGQSDNQDGNGSSGGQSANPDNGGDAQGQAPAQDAESARPAEETQSGGETAFPAGDRPMNTGSDLPADESPADEAPALPADERQTQEGGTEQGRQSEEDSNGDSAGASSGESADNEENRQDSGETDWRARAQNSGGYRQQSSSSTGKSWGTIAICVSVLVLAVLAVFFIRGKNS